MFSDMGRDAASLAPMTLAFVPWVRAALARGAYLGFIAEEDGVAIGGAGLMILDWPPHPLDAQPLRGYVLNVYVAPHHRGRGVARTLMTRIVDEARSRGVRVVTLNASDAGRAMYERLGFEATNEMRLLVPREASA
ncbi:acetyltransferase (GNAT) family protein [Deinococcus yavapaiensis KR-236]|uniref:Acetyltransferase (GNAT) family protein n=2 Tax=Deinococcus TaxID=1298 RepID=A0A318SIB0_9DEIO|nr:acetyltransferase (GNAT) family protein [Deinococcus yavapaiensis KR-236]